jgi:hypothetical protein
VQVRAADGRFQHANQHIVAADLWDGNILEPQTRLGSGFDNRLHRRLHDSKLGEAANRGKIFAIAAEFQLFLLTHDQRFWQNVSLRKSPNSWTWILRGRRPAGAGLRADEGGFTDGKKGQRKEINL